MKKILLIAVAVLTVATVGIYFSASAQAGNANLSSPAAGMQFAASDGFATVGPPHVLKKTIVNQDSAVVGIPGGFAALDSPTTVVCPGTSGNCLIAADQNVQVVGSGAGRWAICSQVDGLFMNPPCPFLGRVPTNGDFVAGAFSQNATVSAGSHTVQTFVFTDAAGSKSIYNINYRVYKP